MKEGRFHDGAEEVLKALEPFDPEMVHTFGDLLSAMRGIPFGGLSGCRYEEGTSRGQFVTPSEGERFAEVLSDATVVRPLFMMGFRERSEVQT